MKKYKIITDTTADIPVEIAKAYDIVVLPLTIIFGTEEYKDQETITTDQLYEKIDRTNIFPKTSATPAFAYKEVFEKYLNEGYDIIFMTISSLISSTMNNAIAAAKMLNAEDRITVLDSKNLSCGIGLQVINIAQALIDGKTLDDIKIMQAMMRDNIVGLFGIQVLDFLFRGGRCSSLSYIFGKALKIKPIIELKDGKMGVKHKIISSKMKPSIKYMLCGTYAKLACQLRILLKISTPSTVIFPAVGSKSPSKISTKVVLPAPEDPMIPTNLPFGIIKDTLCKIVL